MFDFLRPVQDHSLRIMIPEHQKFHHHRRTHRTNSGGHWSESEDEVALSPSVRRHYKAYTVMQKSGFQHTEYVQILTHLCKTELFISLLFLAHGFSCPGFEEERSYQSTCHINVLSALVGLFTGGLGLGAVHRFRWRTMLVMWLIMCIISAVANLLAVITTGIWLDHLSKLKSRTGIVNGLSGLMLLGSVLVGVCFILTSVIICHYWASNSAKYQAVGRMAKRMRSLRRRASKAGSGTDRGCREGSNRVAHYSGGGGGVVSNRHGGGGQQCQTHYQLECHSGDSGGEQQQQHEQERLQHHHHHSIHNQQQQLAASAQRLSSSSLLLLSSSQHSHHHHHYDQQQQQQPQQSTDHHHLHHHPPHHHAAAAGAAHHRSPTPYEIV